MTKKWITKSSIIALLVFALLMPLWFSDPYLVHILIMTCLNIIFVTGFRLILTTGQLSIAHAAFAAIGAYASTLLVVKVGLNFWLALPLAGMVAAIVAVLVGYPTLKIKGAYFAIMTFALGEVIRLIFTNWKGLFEGSSGIIGIPAPNRIVLQGLPVLQFTSKGSYFILSFVLMVISVFSMYRIEKSRVGLIFHAIAASDKLSESVGINVMNYKVLAFSTGCFFAGLGGAIYAHYIQYLNPHSFSFHESVNWIMFCVTGGIASTSGPIIGSILFTWLPEILRATKHLESLISAIILILVILFLPNGLISLPGHIRGWVNRFSRTQVKEKNHAPT